ncbi:MAG: helix-turn-helix domain-containing protein [Renibacterium sp.]|nr:helix-turn-helix domain-containing protein [Renibacterium sp.]
MNTELPDPWGEYAERKGANSFRAIARLTGVSVETARKVILGLRTPTPETARKLAEGLGVELEHLNVWLGYRGDDASPYVPPAEAARLNRRQRRAVDEIIRAMVERSTVEVSAKPSESVPTTGAASYDDSSTMFDLAAHPPLNTAEARERRAADSRGEESQEEGCDR